MSGHTLVIVESPAKAKKIAGYLSEGLDATTFDVLASVGHIRDLGKKADVPKEFQKEPWAKLAVNVDANFTPYYVVHESKKATIRDLKAALKDADELILATDEDREGEAIAWHLLEVLRPKVPVKRMVFNEITPEAIRAAVQNTRDVDMRLVEAQETRRVIDRLYGYPVSEVLWKKIGREAKSAGRVQSVAVRLVVDRERERIAHTAASYWDIKGLFESENAAKFGAKLASVDGKKVAGGSDFDDLGQLKTNDVVRVDEATAKALAEGLKGATFTVRSVTERPGTRRPKAPFMTSTLQQGASGALRWSSQRTMRVAQSLYENGYITYMRTDSTNLSDQAISAARAQAKELYGEKFVADAPRKYANKVKNAQEAHEAIRPAGDHFQTPAQLAGTLSGDEMMLYELIWKRTVASQMSDAKIATTTVRLGAQSTDGKDAEFTVSGTVVLFPGFEACLKDTKVASDDDDDAEGELPQLSEGHSVKALSLEPLAHATKPPARYTEATLIAALEERGIGRPSTYASIMSTIVERGYVWKKGTALVPSFVAFAVVRLLEEHFGELVDYDFTAQLEGRLDMIANGEFEKEAELKVFWNGEDDGVHGAFRGIKELTEDLGAIDARELSTFEIAGTDAVLRVGRYGAYVERGEDERANIPVDMCPDELTAEVAEALLLMPSGDRELGVDPESGLEIMAKSGRYGPYVTEVLPEGSPKSAKPNTASLFDGMDLNSVTLDDALKLLSLPRIVGVDPATNEEITAQNGRYGPYLTKGKDSRTLDSQDRIFSITLEEALEIYSQPKMRRGQVARPPLRELGADPSTGLNMIIKEGRFGAYITDGETNASLRAVDKVETITVERASDLLAERRAAGPSTKKKVAKKTVKKTAKKAAKKTTKKAAKKTATKTVKKARPAKKTGVGAAETTPVTE